MRHPMTSCKMCFIRESIRSPNPPPATGGWTSLRPRTGDLHLNRSLNRTAGASVFRLRQQTIAIVRSRVPGRHREVRKTLHPTGAFCVVGIVAHRQDDVLFTAAAKHVEMAVSERQAEGRLLWQNAAMVTHRRRHETFSDGLLNSCCPRQRLPPNVHPARVVLSAVRRSVFPHGRDACGSEKTI